MGRTDLFAMDVDLEEMGRRIDRARLDAGLSMFELVISTAINDSLLRRYVKGKAEPGATRIAKIADVLGVNADWLLQNTDNPAPVQEKWDGKTERRSNRPNGGAGPPQESAHPPRRTRREHRRSA